MYDVYACDNCGFMNGTKRDFIRLDKGRLVCPDCGSDKNTYIQGPANDREIERAREYDDNNDTPLE